jgi:hypothetical protein
VADPTPQKTHATKTGNPQAVKRGRGAPKIVDEEKRTKRVVLNLTQDEKDAINTYARSKKIKITEFFRLAAEEYMNKHK